MSNIEKIKLKKDEPGVYRTQTSLNPRKGSNSYKALQVIKSDPSRWWRTCETYGATSTYGDTWGEQNNYLIRLFTAGHIDMRRVKSMTSNFACEWRLCVPKKAAGRVFPAVTKRRKLIVSFKIDGCEIWSNWINREEDGYYVNLVHPSDTNKEGVNVVKTEIKRWLVNQLHNRWGFYIMDNRKNAKRFGIKPKCAEYFPFA